MASTPDEARVLLAYAEAIQAERRATDALVHWTPHAKQQAFIDAVLGTQWYENWFVAANRAGKSDAGVYCDAQLLRYGIDPIRPAIGPSTVVWDRATSLWIVGPDYKTLTTVLLPKLLDWPGIDVPPGAAHQPFIPRWEMASWHADQQRGKLKNGSLVQCKSNEQSQIVFAAAGVDGVHFDEEPLLRNYEESTLRVEAGRRLRIYGTCTLLPPEGQVGGVSWLYNDIIRPFLQGKRGIGLFGASIWDNPYLLPEEIARLESKYVEGTPTYRIRLGGEWLPGIGGNQCYVKFRHDLHVKTQGVPVWHAPLCWFIDFNIDPFCAGVGQYLQRRFHVYQTFELASDDIDAMVETFRQAYPTHGADIWLYGDATGQARSVQTAQSNYTLIRRAMQDYPTSLKLNIPTVNPHTKDRVNAVNRALMDNHGQISVEIDPSCEPLILDLEQVLADAQGGPKKTTNRKDPYFFRTHSSDAFGYWIHQVAPVVGLANNSSPPQAFAIATGSPFKRAGAPQAVAGGGLRR